MSKLIIGIDEVGRGCWAGPLVVGAVILEKPILGLVDSKTITRSKRTLLAQQIKVESLAHSTGWVTASEVDTLGLTAATTLAIKRAIDAMTDYDQIIIDGSFNYLPNNPKARALIKADGSVPCVSAASILAKVARDDYMIEQTTNYPMYGFDKHVGYGTAQHRAAIIDYGVTPLHRISYKPIQLIMNGYAA